MSILSPPSSKNHRKKSTDIAEIICPDIKTIPSVNDVVENILIETMNAKFCDGHCQESFSEGEDDDGNCINEENKRSKASAFLHKYFLSYLSKIRQVITSIVASKYFRRLVLSSIVINTLSMGIEYHGQPPSLTNALEYSNLVFTSLFAIEMIFKIVAEGCLKYIKNAYNLFDSAIVIMSIVELQGNKNSGLSVLRTFRLLRVLKLVRFMPTLRRQLVRQKFQLIFFLFLFYSLSSKRMIVKDTHICK